MTRDDELRLLEILLKDYVKTGLVWLNDGEGFAHQVRDVCIDGHELLLWDTVQK